MTINVQDFIDWVRQDPRGRKAEIIIDVPRRWYASNPTVTVQANVYDYKLSQGQTVQAVAEIDLAGEKRKAQLAEYERLKVILEEGRYHA